MLRYITAGESHGEGLVGIIEGIPAGLNLLAEDIDKDLARRQLGYGRGGRMKIESDRARIISGVRHGVTLGSPIAILIENRDWKNWTEKMSVAPVDAPAEPATRPRPGHADLPGLLKTDQKDVRNILERASARETAIRTALGAVAKVLLAELGIVIISHVVRIGRAALSADFSPAPGDLDRIDESPVRCIDADVSAEMVAQIKEAAADKDTLGGAFEVIAFGCPPGLGSYIQWDRRLNANLCRAVAGIPAIKGVQIGAGFALASVRGSQAHDEIVHDQNGYHRTSNRAGGIDGGMSNGEPIVVSAVMKPIPTLGAGLRTVDIQTKETATAMSERSDICAVPAAAVIGEAAVALELAAAVLDKFGGDSARELLRNYRGYIDQIT